MPFLDDATDDEPSSVPHDDPKTKTLAEEIREIIAALNEIRAQLAEQNEHLDSLAERYIKSPAQAEFDDEDEEEDEFLPLQDCDPNCADEELRADRDGLDAISSAVIADCERRFQPLLDRIERKVDEVRGLRDLVNETDVRDASRETRRAENSRQNRCTLVFAVTAVLYLSVFGMRLFDLNNEATAFIVTFAALAVATYAIATGWIRTMPAGVSQNPAPIRRAPRLWLSNLVGRRTSRGEAA
ncbi:uncharacterized protein BJX67DRAFT_309911 [Aspergillus lucknowensis]|uniref:Uncharacterized protein n=1 Tax=Aspergillus lucknowensis TaxID=176173 RepID=A0ABR4LCP0_9EURO